MQASLNHTIALLGCIINAILMEWTAIVRDRSTHAYLYQIYDALKGYWWNRKMY